MSENNSLSKYKYIIIDEFQDISDGRYDLITILKQNTKTKLFVLVMIGKRFMGSLVPDHKIDKF